jgi:uncharacterized membrane protein
MLIGSPLLFVVMVVVMLLVVMVMVVMFLVMVMLFGISLVHARHADGEGKHQAQDKLCQVRLPQCGGAS